MTITVFQFQLDGQPKGILRRSWDDAAGDAIRNGHAIRIGPRVIETTASAKIAKRFFKERS